MSELQARLRNHFGFSEKEISQILISALAISFGLSLWRGWGAFDIVQSEGMLSYVINFAIIAALVVVSLFIHSAAQKIISIMLGYDSKYKYWELGLFIGVFFSFVTGGFLPLFFPGSLQVSTIPKLRVGLLRQGVMHRDLGIIAAAGPIMNLIFVGIIMPFYLWTLHPLIYALIAINLLTAVWSLLPMPIFEKIKDIKGGTPGLHLFISSRVVYIFLFFTVLTFSLLILIAKVFSYLLAIFIGLLLAFIYNRTFEKARK